MKNKRFQVSALQYFSLFYELIHWLVRNGKR